MPQDMGYELAVLSKIEEGYKNLAVTGIKVALKDYLLDKMGEDDLKYLGRWCERLNISEDFVRKEFKRLYVASMDYGFVYYKHIKASNKHGKAITIASKKKVLSNNLLVEYQNNYAKKSGRPFLQVKKFKIY